MRLRAFCSLYGGSGDASSKEEKLNLDRNVHLKTILFFLSFMTSRESAAVDEHEPATAGHEYAGSSCLANAALFSISLDGI